MNVEAKLPVKDNKRAPNMIFTQTTSYNSNKLNGDDTHHVEVYTYALFVSSKLLTCAYGETKNLSSFLLRIFDAVALPFHVFCFYSCSLLFVLFAILFAAGRV